jgi:hypothetical protein
MKVFIYGLNGNMGQRYKTICQSLGHEVGGHDVTPFESSFSRFEADRIIVATPTSTHAEILHGIVALKKPVLCEKPVTKSRRDLYELVERYRTYGTPLSIVSQYDELVDPEWEGETLYDYFKSGPDGLHWDCLNVVWHAKSGVTLRKVSPVWTCRINGKELDLRLMDYAYIAMLRKWLAEPESHYDRILESHEKAVQMGAKWL